MNKYLKKKEFFPVATVFPKLHLPGKKRAVLCSNGSSVYQSSQLPTPLAPCLSSRCNGCLGEETSLERGSMGSICC